MFDDVLARHDAAGRHDEVIGRTGKLALLGLAVVLAVAAPLFESFLLFTFAEVLVFVLLALSLDFVFGYTYLPSFGHAAMFGAGGYAAAFLLMGQMQNPLVVLPAAFLVGFVVAAIVGWLSVRSHGVYFAMLTLAFAQVLYIVAFNDIPTSVLGVETVTGGDNGLVGIPTFQVAGVGFGSNLLYYYLTLGLVAASVAVIFRLANSPFGRVLQGMRENEDRIEALGYDVTTYKVAGFALSGGFTGLAGGLYVPLQTLVHPQFLHWALSGELIVMVLLGGMGSLWGPMLGAALVVLLEDFLSGIQGWRLVLGTLFIVMVIFAPEGIAGLLRSLRRDPRGVVENVRLTFVEYVRKVRS